MRVLLISYYFPPEIGTASHLFHDLACGLRDSGHEVSVLTGFPRYNVPDGMTAAYRGLHRRERMDGIDVLRVRWPRLPRGSMLGRGLEQFVAAAALATRGLAAGRHEVTVVYSPPLTLGISAWLLSRVGHSGPFVLNVQDLFPQSAIDLGAMGSRLQIAFFRWLEQRLYRAAACVTVHSAGNAAHVQASAGEAARVVVVPNWADAQLFAPHARDPELLGRAGENGAFVVSFAGTMGLSQDMDTIVRAASRLRGYSDIVFLLVGDGMCRVAAQRLATDLNLQNVQWLPMQPRERYPRILATSDVSLVTLKGAVRTPVVPSKLLSIMASGRPAVVAADPAGEAVHLVREARCGICVPPEDPERMAEAIVRLHDDGALAAKLGRNGREYAREHFTLHACARIYERIFTAVRRGDTTALTSGDVAPRQ